MPDFRHQPTPSALMMSTLLEVLKYSLRARTGIQIPLISSTAQTDAITNDHKTYFSLSMPQAQAGDRIKIQGRGPGQPAQTAEVVEVRGSNGQPPYVVRFSDGHERLIYPGPDTVVESAGDS
ncbi:hypothetical protein BJY04DRAFT_222374 [Aspergillus karnatakaensis]|uniref:DUF1918 domain-containing protein n=1 Tax=Aspergillus karnatakaensis TaxID=1810916 RepID=UPI003CCCC420